MCGVALLQDCAGEISPASEREAVFSFLSEAEARLNMLK